MLDDDAALHQQPLVGQRVDVVGRLEVAVERPPHRQHQPAEQQGEQKHLGVYHLPLGTLPDDAALRRVLLRGRRHGNGIKHVVHSDTPSSNRLLCGKSHTALIDGVPTCAYTLIAL